MGRLVPAFFILLLVSPALGADDTRSPTVLIDSGHHNLGDSEGRASIIRFLRPHGYEFKELYGQFSEEALQGVDVAIIEGALSARNALVIRPPTPEQISSAWRLPAPTAFAPSEIEILRRWVMDGGSLLIVFDHMPVAGAAQELCGAFGIEVSNGYAVNASQLEDLSAPTIARAGSVVFDRADGSLESHAITDGRDPSERIDRAATYVGSAFRLPSQGQSLLTLGASFVALLPEVAWEFSESTPRASIGGWSQGGVLRVGKGRLAVFGEYGVLVSPEMVENPDKPDNPQRQNPQLLLNTLRWLTE